MLGTGFARGLAVECSREEGAKTEVQVFGLGAGMMAFAVDQEGRGDEVRPLLGGVGEGWGLGRIRNSVWDVTLEVSFRHCKWRV